MPKNHCSIRFNIATKMWEGSHNGHVLATSADMRRVQNEMFWSGYNIQHVDTASDQDLAAAIIRNGCD